MQFDKKLIRQTTKAMAVEIRGLKGLQRQSGQPNWNLDKVYRLLALKRDIHALYALLANSRQKVHGHKGTLESQQEYLQKRSAWLLKRGFVKAETPEPHTPPV